MKRLNKFLFLLVMIIFSLFIMDKNVKAAGETQCSLVEKNELKTKAANIKINYEINTTEKKVKDTNGEELTVPTRSVDIKIFNITSDLFITMDSSNQNVSMESKRINYTMMGADGAITLRLPSLDIISEYIFDIYTFSDNCQGDVVRTIKLTIPKYNVYSQLEACSGIESYYLCQEYITFDVNPDTFYEKVNDFKENGQVTADDLINQQNLANNIVIKSPTAKYIIIGLIIVAGIVATYFILRKNKKER